MESARREVDRPWEQQATELLLPLLPGCPILSYPLVPSGKRDPWGCSLLATQRQPHLTLVVILGKGGHSFT